MFHYLGLYCIACDIYYSTDFQKQYTVMQKQYTNISHSCPIHKNQNNMYTETNSSNTNNLQIKKLQNINGPGRIRTNDPRHVKAVS